MACRTAREGEAGMPIGRSRQGWLFRCMTDRLDVVAVGVEHERAVIMFVIMRPQARLAVVAATCSERGLVERIDIGPGLGRKRDVEASPQHAFAVADPEI